MTDSHDGSIDVEKLRRYVNKHSDMLNKRAVLNGEIRALLNQAEDSGFEKKAVESVSKRKNKDRDAAIAFGHTVEKYEIALGLATQDMFDGIEDPDAAAEAKAEAAGDPVPEPPSPKVAALPAPSPVAPSAPAPKAKKAKKAGTAKAAKKKAADHGKAAAATVAPAGPSEEPQTANADAPAADTAPADPPSEPPPSPTTEFAFEAGKRAAKAGWAETRNPYKQDEISKARWASGFKAELDEQFERNEPLPPPAPPRQESETAPA